MQRSPPAKIQKYSSNPDLPESGEGDDDFVSFRRRRLPEDDNTKRMMDYVEKKLSAELDSWKSQLDVVIADSIKNSIDSILDKEIKNITSTINNSLKTFGDKLDNIEKSLSYAMERQDSIDSRLKQVESRLSSSDDISSQVTQLQDKIDSMEQQARLYNIEIANLPERRDENLLAIVEKIGAVIKHPINKSDIVSAHRVPHFDKKCTRPKNIIVKFSTKILRDNFMAASRANRGLKSDQLCMPGTVCSVYVNEHLTAKNKQLFRLCREEAKKCSFKFVWVSRGTVLVRQSESSPIFAIRCEQDLKKIKA
ncbi:uncharacterized protein LOC114365561 [Ostrinia furnacalis]|uniref:uncharacterized protein LOC114365561 n=1 Tax=Ostrinia furnacalis TaxID=93504 RepID=UPI00103A5C94|nr:uncharacterized protein LOC114365561 [Ostrinia furnacalis]